MTEIGPEEAAQIVPDYSPKTVPPRILTDATRHLEVATNEFYLALQRFEIWRVLAYNKDLVERLGKGYATGGYISVRSAIFEALLITLTRMFDQGARGRQPLSLRNICNDICRPEARTYVVDLRAAVARDFPARLGLVTPLGEADRAHFEELAQADACRASERANGEFVALVRLQRALGRPRIAQALARLHRLRDTEIAHRDLEPTATTLARPMYRDLDTLFGAAAVLIRRMNILGRNLDINYANFSQRARLRARAFAVGLRAEIAGGTPPACARQQTRGGHPVITPSRRRPALAEGRVDHSISPRCHFSKSASVTVMES